MGSVQILHFRLVIQCLFELLGNLWFVLIGNAFQYCSGEMKLTNLNALQTPSL
jgi:hypothetical protein